MPDSMWLIDEFRPPDEKDYRQLERELPTDVDQVTRGRRRAPYLAIALHDVVIHNTRKLFGGADIRIDALVTSVPGPEDARGTFYMPGTFRFSGVDKGDRLPIDTGGLLIYHGRPQYFLDIAIMASRDRKDSDDLAALIAGHADSPEVRDSLSTIAGLASVVPQAAMVTEAVQAGLKLGSVFFQIVQSVAGRTIGLYRTSWLQHRDRFGMGRHPEKDIFRHRDFSFWYEVVLEKPR